MREIRPSGLEGGVESKLHPYPYPFHSPSSLPITNGYRFCADFVSYDLNDIHHLLILA
jgi:hypothetical protein